ncbi:class I SAM-dependent methyltransferase [Ruegeria lacuscaerulensis]|uniref:class I SAM-dependent methyltransferase n=1 Tax=Ruegeria lacuscaerulensis TaxID=55218 RepID=UPI00147C7393|nr:methyltransferase domain-containing protein [Ruegeria lacuscaerulensis]
MAADNFRLTKEAALKYDSHCVPAMFGPLAQATMEKVNLRNGAHIVDIACGTGALTREIAKTLSGKGRIVGVDLNETMIEVARANQPESDHTFEWHAADVCNIPYKDGSFDYAFIQQGLQFFPDKPAALTEVHRILRDQGQLFLTCWRAVSPFNGALADALERHVGPDAATKAKAPFSFRDGDLISNLLTDAGFQISRQDALVLERRFEDLRAQIMALPIEVDLRKAGDRIAEAVVAEVAAKLAQYDRSGVLHVPQEAHLFVAET